MPFCPLVTQSGHRGLPRIQPPIELRAAGMARPRNVEYFASRAPHYAMTRNDRDAASLFDASINSRRTVSDCFRS